MSDRFKFRAWNNELEGYGYFNLGGKPRWDSVTKGNKTYHYSGLDCADTVEQCTGLKDENGTLIFEGDIIDDRLVGVGEVIFNRYAFKTSFKNNIGKWFSDYLESEIKSIKIIGNIHEEAANE